MERKTSTFLFIIIPILLSGCGTQKTVAKKYLTLEQTKIKPAKPLVEHSPLVNARCQVETVEVYPAYSTRNIVFRDASHQIRYFGEYEWAVRPSDILTPVIIDYLEESNLFLSVSNRFGGNNPEYNVKTRIFKLEVGTADDKKDFAVRLEIKFELTDLQTGRNIVTHYAYRESPLPERNLNSMAEKISGLFYEELTTFAILIKEELADKN